MTHSPKNILVVGATGGTGRALVERLLAEGHQVTAFARHAHRLDMEGLRRLDGDALDPNDIERAVPGHDAVVVTLGIRENPLRVRLLGPAHTPMDVRSAGTANVIAAMRRHGVRRLVVQTSYGVGETRDRLRLVDRLIFALLLAPQIADTETQNDAVAASELEWVIAQPVHLTDDADEEMPFLSSSGDTGRMKVSRASVARFLAEAATSDAWIHKCVAVSGALVSPLAA